MKPFEKQTETERFDRVYQSNIAFACIRNRNDVIRCGILGYAYYVFGKY